MQLDAVTKSSYAANLGYKMSYMENLFHQKCYMPNAVTGEFNPQYIVQLKENHRSHSCILSVPNDLFYNGILRAVASSGMTLFLNSFCLAYLIYLSFCDSRLY